MNQRCKGVFFLLLTSAHSWHSSKVPFLKLNSPSLRQWNKNTAPCFASILAVTVAHHHHPTPPPSSSNLIIFKALISDSWAWRERGRKQKKRNIVVLHGSDLLLLYYHSSSLGALETTVFFTHTHTHECTFQGVWWLLVWRWWRVWHHEANSGKHPWLVNGSPCQEGGFRCWWSAGSWLESRPLEAEVNNCSWVSGEAETARVGLLGLIKSIWAQGCLFEQSQLASQILF